MSNSSRTVFPFKASCNPVAPSRPKPFHDIFNFFMYTLFCVGRKSIILTLSQQQMLRLFQTERVSRRQFKLDEKGRQFSERVENMVWKGAIARYEQFLLFSVFSKHLYCGHIKPGLVWERVKSQFHTNQ